MQWWRRWRWWLAVFGAMVCGVPTEPKRRDVEHSAKRWRFVGWLVGGGPQIFKFPTIVQTPHAASFLILPYPPLTLSAVDLVDLVTWVLFFGWR